MKRAWFVLLAVSLTGCYAYAPVDNVMPTPGTEVRAYLTPEGAQQLTPQYGPGVQSLDGRFLGAAGAGPDSLIMTVDWVNAASTTFSIAGNEGLRLPQEQVAMLEAKQMDIRRSILLAGVIAGGFYLLDRGTSVFSGFVDPPDDGGGEPPQTFRGFRVPFRIPLP